MRQEPGGPAPPSHIHMLSAIWQLLSSLAYRGAVPPLVAPPNQELLLEGLTEASKRDYRRASADFTKWAAGRELRLETPRDFDYALWLYANGLSKSRLGLTLAAVERLWPPLRKALPWTRARVAGLQITVPTLHHPPMLWPIALAIAWGLAVCAPRPVCQLSLLMRLLGLRAGEAIKIKPEDITEGFQNLAAPGTAIVGLGIRGGTKNKRPQAVNVDPGEWRTHLLIRMLMEAATWGCTFTHLRTTTAFNYLIKKACRMAGIKMVWTCHAARAGWATEAWMRGVPFTQLRELGRWKSDSSLRVYLDAVGAMAIQNEPETRAVAGWTAAMDGAAFDSYWRGRAA